MTTNERIDEEKQFVGFSAPVSTGLTVGFGGVFAGIQLAALLAGQTFYSGEAYYYGSAILAVSLLALIWTDFRHFRLPNLITIPLMLAGLAFVIFERPSEAILHLVGAATGYVVIWLLNNTFRLLTKKNGIGMGDAKLFAAAGAWFGVLSLPVVFLSASLLGIIFTVTINVAFHNVRTRTKQFVPFGPAIALTIWLIWNFGGVLPTMR
ncbi:MAG: hypothetical protein CMK07_12745 [Ponticaulis sp.]|nr:hypothetical protein [Ponticaulis sp.]